jgi:hypothetical protein
LLIYYPFDLVSRSRRQPKGRRTDSSTTHGVMERSSYGRSGSVERRVGGDVHRREPSFAPSTFGRTNSVPTYRASRNRAVLDPSPSYIRSYRTPRARGTPARPPLLTRNRVRLVRNESVRDSRRRPDVVSNAVVSISTVLLVASVGVPTLVYFCSRSTLFRVRSVARVVNERSSDPR